MLKKQPNSRMCFVCGMDNPIGLKLFFYEDDEGRVIADFTPREEHQGYPGVLHGGIAATLLDEVAGRVVSSRNLWMVTAKLEIRYHKPVPLGQRLTVIGEMVRLQRRTMETRGEIRLEDGSLAVESKGLYLKIPDEELEAIKETIGDDWRVVPD